ncbi:hypothetical protein F4859DRAFT_492321 [Xylaria cf. heliscus]|nr:hypothetical protein F4859DRAFT_492321 [Xylaria cf. heliscus]
MPFNNTHTGLKTELSKLAKVSNIQAGLPFILRGLPVAAILVGEAIAKHSGGPNRVEQLLGFDETLLNMPSQNRSVGTTENKRECAQQGVMMMCARCWKTRTERAVAAKLGFIVDQDQWRRHAYDEQFSFGQRNVRKRFAI